MNYEDHRLMRRLRDEGQADEVYRDAYEAAEAEQRSEWEAEFDTIPYRPNGAELHRLALARMGAMID